MTSFQSAPRRSPRGKVAVEQPVRHVVLFQSAPRRSPRGKARGGRPDARAEVSIRPAAIAAGKDGDVRPPADPGRFQSAPRRSPRGKDHQHAARRVAVLVSIRPAAIAAGKGAVDGVRAENVVVSIRPAAIAAGKAGTRRAGAAGEPRFNPPRGDRRGERSTTRGSTTRRPCFNPPRGDRRGESGGRPVTPEEIREFQSAPRRSPRGKTSAVTSCCSASRFQSAPRRSPRGKSVTSVGRGSSNSFNPPRGDRRGERGVRGTDQQQRRVSIRPAAIAAGKGCRTRPERGRTTVSIRPAAIAAGKGRVRVCGGDDRPGFNPPRGDRRGESGLRAAVGGRVAVSIRPAAIAAGKARCHNFRRDREIGAQSREPLPAEISASVLRLPRNSQRASIPGFVFRRETNALRRALRVRGGVPGYAMRGAERSGGGRTPWCSVRATDDASMK